MTEFYEINIKDYNKIFVFCKKEEYTKNKKDKIFTDIYIYDDDTITEVYNKIKLSLINNIERYNENDFENICGYLSGKWNYYSDYKKNEFIDNVKDKNMDIVIGDDLVIGYYMLDTKNDYKYYISPIYFKRQIDNNIIIENEYNKPINNYRNYDKNYKSVILRSYDFELIDNNLFRKMNNFSIFNSIKNSSYDILNNIYKTIDINKNKLKLDQTNYDANEIFNEDIGLLCLEIKHNLKLSLLDFFNNLELDVNYPLCILRDRDNKKKIEKYKLLHDENNIPVLKINKLKDILKVKSKTKEDHILIKYKYNKNYYYDIYIYSKNKFSIVFKFGENNINKIKLNDIINEINNILDDFNFKIGNSNKINSIDEFIYYNNNDYIKINNSNEIKCSEFNINLSLNELIDNQQKKRLINNFLNYVILNNTDYDLDINKIEVLYNNNQEDIIKDIIEDEGEYKILLNKNNELVDELNKIKLNNNKIKLFYKKSFNSDSYNYLKKFYKNVMTYEQDKQSMLLKCPLSGAITENFKKFLFNNGMFNEDDFSNININMIFDSTNKEDKNYCLNMLYNSNRQTEINVFIHLTKLQITVFNISTLNELKNIKDSFINFIRFNNIKKQDKLILSNNLYSEVQENIYKNYNNIYNLYNISNKTNLNEYYLYLLYKGLDDSKDESVDDMINLDDDIKLIDDSDDDIDLEMSSNDDEDEDESSDSDDEIDYDNIKNIDNELKYKIEQNTTENRELYTKLFSKEYNQLCILEKRPSIISDDDIKILQERETKGEILINGSKTDYFNKLINLDENIIDLEILDYKIILSDKSISNLSIDKKTKEELSIEKNINKTKLAFCKGRYYTINIKYNENDVNKNKLILCEKLYISNLPYVIFNESNIKKDDINIINNLGEELDYEQYMNDKTNEYTIKFKYKQTVQNDDNFVSLCLLDEQTEKILTILEDEDGNNYTLNSNNGPKKYYYDEDLYGNNYFVCLPGTSKSSQQLDNNEFAPNYIVDGSSGLCCLKKGLHKITDIYDNKNKKPYDASIYNKERLDKLFTEESDYKLKHLKLGKIYKPIYDNIMKFLSIEDNIELSYKNNRELTEGHLYRLGIIEDSNISNMILSLLYIMKYEKKNLNIDLKLNFLLDNRYFELESIKMMFNLYIDSLDINELLNLNNGIYVKLPENLVNASRMVDYDEKTSKSEIKIKNDKIENIIRTGLKEYINNNLSNLDINLIWDVMSDIFKINIIIIEVTNKNGILESAIRCPNINKKTSILNKRFKNYCLLLKFKNTYQPLVFYKKTKDLFNMVFNVNNRSYGYLEQLFDKCLLKYNNNIYNNVLLNAIYNDVKIENFIVISDTDLEDIIEEEINIKYVINMNLNNVGILLSNKDIKSELFIPINSLRHKLSYKKMIGNNKINNIFLDNIENNDIVKTIDETKTIIESYYKLHEKDILNLNNKYLTTVINKEEYIIGIGLNINEYVPVKRKKVADFDLDINDTLEGYHYYKQKQNIDVSVLQDMKNENILLYYKRFMEFIGELLELKDDKYKLEFKELCNNKEYKDLEKELKKILSNNVVFDDNNLIEKINNNYLINIVKDKKIYLSKNMYNIFINRIIYDLIHNIYRRNEIINNWFDKTIIIKENQNNLIYDKNDLETETIYELYNNRISDKYYDKVGINYERLKKNDVYTKNTKYCEKENEIKDDDGINYIYFGFKSLIKTNEIYYSDCIYYYIGKYIFDLKTNMIETTRNLIANKLKENIENNYLISNNVKIENVDLQMLIEIYTDLTKMHLYSSISSLGELVNKLISVEHWITELDLSIITELKDVTIKIMYSDREDGVINKVRTLGNNSKNIHYIYLQKVYEKKLYFYMKQK